MKAIPVLATFFLVGSYVACADAATVPDGKIIVRIDDGVSTRCINSSKDAITMHMRRLIANKQVGIFTEDKEAALLINTVLSGEEQGQSPKKVNFPRMFTATVEPYGKGYVSLPIEEKIFSRFALTSESYTYDSAEIEFAVLAKKKKSPFGVALTALADISKNMPLPLNPFSDGFKYFSEYANKVLDASLTEQNNVSSQSKEGKIALSFSGADVCTGDQEKTGTLAVISGAAGLEADGYLDIKREYCWKAQITPVFILKFATKPTSGACTAVSDATYRQVNNPYMAFYLAAIPKVITSSAVAQTKVISPSAAEGGKPNIPVEAIEKSIRSAYAEATSASTTTPEATRKLASRVNSLLKTGEIKPQTGSRLGLGDAVAFPTTAADSVAIDLAESFKRCAIHGISAEKCL